VDQSQIPNLEQMDEQQAHRLLLNRAICQRLHLELGRNFQPSAGIGDSQSREGADKSTNSCGSRVSMANVGKLSTLELRRTPLPRTRVNKAPEPLVASRFRSE
jgi:hypothetical protein